MKVFTSTVVVTSTLGWLQLSIRPNEGLSHESDIGSSTLDSPAGNVGEPVPTLISTAPESPEAGIPVWTSTVGELGSPTVTSIGTTPVVIFLPPAPLTLLEISTTPGTSSLAAVPTSAPSDNLAPPATPPALTAATAPPIASASGPAITSFETQTINPSVTSSPTLLYSSTSTQSSLSDAQESQEQGLSIPIGAFAVLMVLAGVLGVVFLGLASLALRIIRKRKADNNLNQGGNVAAVAAFQETVPQRDGDQTNSTMAGSNGAVMSSGGAQQQSERNNMRLSVFPGWPKRLVQYVKGNGGGKRHVDFEMVTGDQAGR